MKTINYDSRSALLSTPEQELVYYFNQIERSKHYLVNSIQNKVKSFSSIHQVNEYIKALNYIVIDQNKAEYNLTCSIKAPFGRLQGLDFNIYKRTKYLDKFQQYTEVETLTSRYVFDLFPTSTYRDYFFSRLAHFFRTGEGKEPLLVSGYLENLLPLQFAIAKIVGEDYFQFADSVCKPMSKSFADKQTYLKTVAFINTRDNAKEILEYIGNDTTLKVLIVNNINDNRICKFSSKPMLSLEVDLDELCVWMQNKYPKPLDIDVNRREAVNIGYIIEILRKGDWYEVYKLFEHYDVPERNEYFNRGWLLLAQINYILEKHYQTKKEVDDFWKEFTKKTGFKKSRRQVPNSIFKDGSNNVYMFRFGPLKQWWNEKGVHLSENN